MVKRTLCCGCTRRCGLLIEVEDGKPVKVNGDKEHPLSEGHICARGKVIVLEEALHPDRVKYPLKRVGERGSGKWQRISWDEALEDIAARLKQIKDKYGAEAIVATGSGGLTCDQVTRRFMNLLGSPNLMDSGQVCYVDRQKVDMVTLGWIAMYPRRQQTRCAVIWGGNPPVTKPEFGRHYKEAKKRGAKIIVIDPKFTESARMADLWLQIRPASDGALLLGWLNVIIEEKLYDRDFVEKWTNAPYLVRSDTEKLLRESDVVEGGNPERFMAWEPVAKQPRAFNRETLSYEPPDAKPALTGAFVVTLANGRRVECKTVWQLLKERVATYTPERVAEITWVPADKILDAVRMYATTKPATFEGFLGMDGIGRNSVQALRGRDIIRTITGNLDVEGGDISAGPYTKIRFDYEIEENDKLSPEQKRKNLGSADMFRLFSFESHEELWNYQKKAGFPNPLPSMMECACHPPTVWRAILTGKPYPVKALFNIYMNPMVMSSNTSLVFEALKKLDLLVVADIFMTPTAELADYVLPSAIQGLEGSFLHTFYNVTNFVSSGERAFGPLWECRSHWEIFHELGVIMGQDWPWKTEEEMYDWQLEPLGYTWKEFIDKVRYITPPIEFKKYEKTGFGTPSGKVEIYSSHLEKIGYDPLLHYEEPAESPVSTPELAKEYPYILASGRVPLFYNSEHLQVESIRKRRPDPLILINPETAASLGVNEGDWVWIESPLGKRIKQRVNLFDGIHPKVVYPDVGWWFPEMPAPEHGVWESNINVIIDDDPETYCDQMIGSWPYNGLLCKIYKM